MGLGGLQVALHNDRQQLYVDSITWSDNYNKTKFTDSIIKKERKKEFFSSFFC